MKFASRGILFLVVGLMLWLPGSRAWSKSPEAPKDPIGGMSAEAILKALKPYLGTHKAVILTLTRNTPITDPFQEVREDVEQDVAVVSVKSAEQQGDDLFLTLSGIDRDSSQGMADQTEMMRISTDDGSFRVHGVGPGPEISNLVGFSAPALDRKTAGLVKDAGLQP